MLDFLSSRLILALFYLAALFMGGVLLLGQLRRAEGFLFIAEGSTESVLVRESTGRSGFGALHGMPGEAIPFDNPSMAARRLDRNAAYDMVKLPFHVRLDAVEAIEERPRRDVLQVVDGPELSPGDRVSLTEGELHFESTEPWCGLLREPGGRPGARLSLRKDGHASWTALVVDETDWVTRDGVTVQMTWCDSADAAHEALPDQYEPRAMAQWRVKDGGTEHISTGLLPGAGLSLSDGRRVEILRFEPDGTPDFPAVPAVQIRVTGDGPPRMRWIAANGDADAAIRVRYPAETAVFLRPYGYNEAWVRLFDNNGDTHDQQLEAGVPWRLADLELRLDDALSTALMIRAEDRAVFQANATLDGEPIQLREGDARTFNRGTKLVFRRVEVAPLSRHRLTVLSPNQEELGALTVDPRESRRFGNWRFAQSPNDRNVLHSAVLRVHRTLNRPATWAGLVCFAGGAVGLTIARLRRPRRRRRRAAPELGVGPDR